MYTQRTNGARSCRCRKLTRSSLKSGPHETNTPPSSITMSMPSSRTSRRDRQLLGENTSANRRSDSVQGESVAHESAIPQGPQKLASRGPRVILLFKSRSMSTGGGRTSGVIGIHPAAAFGVVVVDNMLFGGTVATLGTGWIASVPIGVALGIAVILIQHRGSPQDDLGLAAGKGILVAILTAIPTSLASALPAAAGIAGAVQMFRNRRCRRLGSRTSRSKASTHSPNVP